MLRNGALDEAERLRARGLSSELPVMRAVGLPPLVAHLEGRLDLDSAAEQMRTDTRRYVKRQLTWFRNQAPDWPRADPFSPAS
jgi:tRNA dimethylallyltransferase